MSFIQLTEDDFDEQFIPVENPEHGQSDYQFDAYNAKDKDFLEYIAINYPNHIWTRIDGEDGKIYNINGWHIVDSIDYIITEIPWKNCHEYEVLNYSPYH